MVFFGNIFSVFTLKDFDLNFYNFNKLRSFCLLFYFCFALFFFTGKIYTRSLAKIFVQLLVVVVAVVFFILLHFFRLLLFGGYQDFISYFIFRHTRIQRNNNDNNNNKNNNNTNKLSVAQQLRRKNSYEMMQAVK